MINFTNITTEELNLNIFKKVENIVLSYEEISLDKEISLSITNSQMMQQFNRRYRGVDRPTDVLSFPMEIDDVPILGDIIIDIETANKQKGNNNLEEELQFLFLHGLLHLLGYDHITSKDKSIMETKQENYWKEIRSK